MRQDASVECSSSEHGSIVLLAAFLLVTWPFGSLALYTSLLVACYKPLQSRKPNALTRATAFLHRGYSRRFCWWEALELARKLVLTGAVLLIKEERAYLRLLVATLICSSYSVGLAAVRPYKRIEDNVRSHPSRSETPSLRCQMNKRTMHRCSVSPPASYSSSSSSALIGPPFSSGSRSGTREPTLPTS